MRSPRPNRPNQDGFSLIELMVALVLIAIMFLGLGVALMASMSGTADSRRNQQSADLIAELTESARSAQYASVAVKDPAGSPPLTSDPNVTTSAGQYYADVNGSDPGGQELMLIDPAGVVIAQQQLERDGANYQVYNYVTIPSGAVNYKRLTTVVQWQQGGATHTRQASTYIAKTQRGLPLPDFVFKSAMSGLPGGDSPTVDSGSTLDLFVSLTNRGARDAWTISATGKSWAWQYNEATGPDTSNLTPLASATTPTIQTDGNMFINIHVPNVTGGAGTYPITVRATSVAQPSVYKEVTFNVSVTTLCAGCTYKSLFLHNTPTSAGCTGTPCTSPNSTRVTTDLYADFSAPLWPTNPAPDFDTDISPAGPGRWLLKGGNIVSEAATSGKIMVWRWDAASSQMDILPGKNARLTLCMKNTDVAAAPAVTWQVLAQKNSGSAVAVTTAITQTLDGSDPSQFLCTRNQTVVLSPPSGSTWVMKATGSNYRKLFLRIVNPSTENYELAYDSTTYAAMLELPTP